MPSCEPEVMSAADPELGPESRGVQDWERAMADPSQTARGAELDPIAEGKCALWGVELDPMRAGKCAGGGVELNPRAAGKGMGMEGAAARAWPHLGA